MTMTPIEVAVRMLVSLLVAGDYETAAAMTGNDRLSAADLRSAITRYPVD